GGGLAAVRIKDGKIVWKAAPSVCGDRVKCSPAQSAAVTAIPGVVFSGSVDGHMRAYDAASGAIVWDADTAREFETVTGVRARAGLISPVGFKSPTRSSARGSAESPWTVTSRYELRSLDTHCAVRSPGTLTKRVSIGAGGVTHATGCVAEPNGCPDVLRYACS